MLSLQPSVRLFVATQPVDGRKQADSLMAVVRDVFGHEPLSGHLFVFFSKRLDRVRIVYWDRNGLVSGK
jgi:transposase